jgi:hypothetical protein
MQTKIFPFCLMALLLIAASSCKKENKEQSKTDILTAGQWTVSAFTMDVDGDGIHETDIYALYHPCDKDDYRAFKKDGKMEENEGPVKCFGGSPQSETFNWSFANNETQIIIDGDTSTIIELAPSRFHIQALGDGKRNITYVQ